MQKTLIIGDIHACHHELLELLDRAGIGDEDTIVSVGDLVDRGPEPAAVLELFRRRPRSLAVSGNHERKHVRGVLSYGQRVTRLQLGGAYEDHVRWMGSLPYHYESDEVRVVHYGLYPGVPLDEVPEDVRAGTTSGERKLAERFGERPWYELYTDDVPVVFGHHVVGPEPLVVRDRVFGIDTGACHGGRLTGLLLPERRLVSVKAREDHWSRVRRAFQGRVMAELDFGAMTFESIERRLRSRLDPELGDDVPARVAAWVHALLAALPGLRERLDAEVARLAEAHGEDFGRAAEAHPAASWLHRRRAGRLSEARLGCGTPEQVVALARALGVPLPDAPGAEVAARADPPG